MGLSGKSITTIGSRLARKSSQRRQVMESFCTKFIWGCKRKVWRDKLVQDLPNDLAHMSFRLQPYVAWPCHYNAMLSKSDVVHMFMET
jgi:hypothetical protein